MTKNSIGLAEEYLNQLCNVIDTRRVGTPGNRQATDFAATVFSSFGWAVKQQEFDCLDWELGGSSLRAGGTEYLVHASPYSLGVEVSAPLAVVSSRVELESVECTGKVLLLKGEITQEQLMPKNFPFYNPAHHQAIYHLLENKQPVAIITATGRNPELAGGMYPFPMIEDGDFDIPSVYMTDVDGEQLANHTGDVVELNIRAARIPAKGVNVVASKPGTSDRRIVVCGHIDAKDNTPGALDNATGVIALLLLAERLRDYSGEIGIELVALNGEDHYSAQGHKEYIAWNDGKFEEIILNINTDVAGCVSQRTAYSLYNCPDRIAHLVREVFEKTPNTFEGEQWYQSDHSVFIQQGVPAVAVTSENFMQLSTDVTHTPKDNPEMVDLDKVWNLAQAIGDILEQLGK
jgi:aminopeptidase YwaD